MGMPENRNIPNSASALVTTWLQEQCAQHPGWGSATTAVFGELCAQAGSAGDPERVLRQRLQGALRIAQCLDEIAPQWIDGSCWQMSQLQRRRLAAIWALYQDLQPLVSCQLDRLLLEAFICEDVDRWAATAGLRADTSPTQPVPLLRRVLPWLPVLAIGAGLLAIAAAALVHVIPAALLAPPQLSSLAALVLAAGWTVRERTRWLQGRRRFMGARVKALRTALLRSQGMPAMIVVMRAAIEDGLRWAPHTVRLLARLRSGASRRQSPAFARIP
jgi:hypothetical protein